MAEQDPGPDIKSDDAWKDKVRAEAAELDAAQSRAATTESPQDDATGSGEHRTRPQIEASQLPPASVTTLISMLSTQAMVALGMLPDPSTGEPDSQPALARHFIDLLGVIEDKTKGNLSADEARLLDSSLHELRMAFVHLQGRVKSGESRDKSQ